MRLAGFFAAAAGLMLLSATQVHAQDPVPRIEDAELVFEQALDAFEEGDYGMAYRRFRLVYETYPVHRKTTATMLMAGKALYRDGNFDRAIDLLNRLIRRYPTSGYLDEARRVVDLAERGGDQDAGRSAVHELGIVLPLQGDDAILAQALFTGIRIAIDEHNALNDQPVRMIFRDSRGESHRAAASVAELAGLGTDAVIGPLYSSEAKAAAQAAERERLVLIPPLANDEAVSQDRRYVFQANPTITTHGRLMARFAIRSLMLDEFGIVAERDRDALSERMAEGFQEEAMLQGADVRFYELLESRSGWARLADQVGEDTLRDVEAVYFPMSGGETAIRVDAAFNSLDAADAVHVRVLGNTEWHGLPNPNRATRYATTYTNDFHVNEDDPSVRAFRNRFREIMGRSPNPSSTVGRLAFTGYDVARYLLPLMIRDSSRPLYERLRDAAMYQGLGLRIDFRNSNVNEAMYYFRYQSGESRLLR